MPCASLIPLLEKEGGSTTTRSPSHGSGPGVGRALNLAYFGQHRPDHDPLFLLTSFRPGASPPRPTPTLVQTGSRALSRYFVPSCLIFQGPASSGSILTKAVVWPRVGGAGAVNPAPPSRPRPQAPSAPVPRPHLSPSQTGAECLPSQRRSPAGGYAPPEHGQGVGLPDPGPGSHCLEKRL